MNVATLLMWSDIPWFNMFCKGLLNEIQCYLLINLTPRVYYWALHNELQHQVNFAMTSETSSARLIDTGMYGVMNIPWTEQKNRIIKIKDNFAAKYQLVYDKCPKNSQKCTFKISCSFIVIIQLVLSVMVGPIVITLREVYCI